MDKFQTAEYKRQKTLRYLRKNPGARVGEIAAMLQMPKSNVHKMLCGMASRGEVSRKDTVNGHRVVEWFAVAHRTTPASTFKRVLRNNLPNRKKVRVSLRKPARRVMLFGGLSA